MSQDIAPLEMVEVDPFIDLTRTPEGSILGGQRQFGAGARAAACPDRPICL